MVVPPDEQMTGDQDDATLAERILRRDGSAENELYARYRGRVFAMALARLKDREWAGELVDDVMMAVIIALRRGTVHDTTRLGAFVHGTTVNVINYQARARSRQPHFATIDDEFVGVDHAEALERDSDLCLVRACLRQLTPTEQQVLTLSLVEGLKPGEIADRLGTSAEAVRQQKSRALRKLKNKLPSVSRNPSLLPLWRK